MMETRRIVKISAGRKAIVNLETRKIEAVFKDGHGRIDDTLTYRDKLLIEEALEQLS